MSSQKSLGLSIQISAEMRKSLSSAPQSSTEASAHQLVKLVPLSRRRGDEETEEEEVKESIVEESAAILQDDKEANNNEIDNKTEDEDEVEEPLVHVSAPRLVEEEEDVSDDDDDDLSDAPPPTLPVVICNLERLCGYPLTTASEREAVVEQVQTALGNDDEFDANVTQLFEMTMARHGESSNDDDDDALLSSRQEVAIAYPELLCPSDGSRVLVTARVWKQFDHHTKRKRRHPVVQRIVTHLKHCNRSLVWKNDMLEELLHLAQKEDEARKEVALTAWRGARRKLELDKLYQVRETFQHRLEMARIKCEQLEEERDVLVQESGGGMLQALDLNSHIFNVDNDYVKDSELRGSDDSEDDDGSDGEQDSASSDGDDDGYTASEALRSDDEADDERSVGSNNDETSSRFAKQKDAATATTSSKQEGTATNNKARPDSKKRIRRVNKKRRQLLKNAAQQAQEQQKVEEAMRQEDLLREQFTSEELRMAQAAVQSLTVRAEQVEDLLESLQEDEWEDEEEGYNEPSCNGNAHKNDMDAPKEELTLLDQILAMILGSLSPTTVESTTTEEQTKAEHLRFIGQEHKEILEGWRNHFGRLPRIKTKTVAPAKQVDDEPLPLQLREEMGIMDNDRDWDEDEEGLTSLMNPGHSSVKTNNKTPVPSLRPGGSSLRPGGRVAK